MEAVLNYPSTAFFLLITINKVCEIPYLSDFKELQNDVPLQCLSVIRL